MDYRMFEPDPWSSEPFDWTLGFARLDERGPDDCQWVSFYRPAESGENVVVLLSLCDTQHFVSDVTMVCRTCGLVTFRVCLIDLEALLDEVEDVANPVYCSVPTLRHEIVAIMEMTPCP